MTIIQILVVLLFVGVALFLEQTIPMDATIRTIIRVVIILAVVLWLLDATGLLASGPVFGRHLR